MIRRIVGRLAGAHERPDAAGRPDDAAVRADTATLLRTEEERLRQVVRALPLEARAKVQGELARALVSDAIRIDTPRGTLAFAVLGETSGLRAKGLLSKQPATIAWIDRFAPNSVFWDVGANIGSYGLYAALAADTRVYAFEPAAVNYFLLAANCELNGFGERMTCLQLGLGAGRAVGHLELSQFVPAQSFSFRERGRYPVSSRQACLVTTIDELVGEYGLDCPNYVKIDVPAMTETIIAGAARTLRNPALREIHLEANEASRGGRRVVEMLADVGFGIDGRHPHRKASDLTFVRRHAPVPAPEPSTE
jgi:FkbM family methyltransferase